MKPDTRGEVMSARSHGTFRGARGQHGGTDQPRNLGGPTDDGGSGNRGSADSLGRFAFVRYCGTSHFKRGVISNAA